jgi:cell division protein FtsL
MQKSNFSPALKFLPGAALIIGLLVALWLVFSPHHGLIALYRANRELQETMAQNQTLEEENKNLRAELNRLKNDPDYIEKLARKDLGLIKKNEVLYDFSKRK